MTKLYALPSSCIAEVTSSLGITHGDTEPVLRARLGSAGLQGEHQKALAGGVSDLKFFPVCWLATSLQLGSFAATTVREHQAEAKFLLEWATTDMRPMRHHFSRLQESSCCWNHCSFGGQMVVWQKDSPGEIHSSAVGLPN